MKTLLSLIMFVAVFAAVSAEAQQIYKWQDEKGQWHISQAPRPPARDGQPVEILHIDARPTVQNQIYWRYAWKLGLSNRGNQSIAVNVEIEFLDGDGFVIDTDRQWRVAIAAGETRELTGSNLVSVPGAANVRQVKAKVGSSYRVFDLSSR